MNTQDVATTSNLPQDLRLIEFHVEKLFDEFTYTIPLNLNRHVTAIIAPNGTGKTLCLRMINGLFENKWGIFNDTIFSSVSFKFSDGSRIVIEKSLPKPSEEVTDDSVPESHFRVKIFKGKEHQAEVWNPRLFDPRRAVSLDRYLPFLTRIGPSKWRHDQSGQILTLPEIVETYEDSIPDHIKLSAYGKKPEVLTSITSQIDCKLIETQRLLILRSEMDEPYYHPGKHGRSTLAIAKKAQTLKEIISKEINAYAALSQSLDRSFPKRVIQLPKMLSAEDLKTELLDLDRRRGELMEAGILDTEADDPVALPSGEIAPAISSVLSVYSEDTKKKLSSLSNILSKIKLFKDLIDQRFGKKDVRISKQNGINVTFNNNKVPLEQLSSGEQHQLVLFFELLFEIKKNSLILIDEPELSLHVAWQKKFISDLMKIIDLNKFDVILATHSPQLIGRWGDLVVELGDVFEGDSDDGRSEGQQK